MKLREAENFGKIEVKIGKNHWKIQDFKKWISENRMHSFCWCVHGMKLYFFGKRHMLSFQKRQFHSINVPTKKRYMRFSGVSFFEILDFSVIFLISAWPGCTFLRQNQLDFLANQIFHLKGDSKIYRKYLLPQCKQISFPMVQVLC